jgi:DNA-binding response OmpR family regulator
MKVLIVDDEDHILETLSLAFKRLGHQAVTLSDPLKVLPVVRRQKPDIVMLDIMMPGADGFATYHTLAEDPELAALPVVILTALDDKLTARISREIGAEMIMHKPFDPLEVARKVEEVHRRQSSQEAD